MKKILLAFFIGIIFMFVVSTIICLAQTEIESLGKILKWGMTLTQVQEVIQAIDPQNHSDVHLVYGPREGQYIDSSTISGVLGNRCTSYFGYFDGDSELSYFFFLDDKYFGVNGPVRNLNMDDSSAVFDFIKLLKDRFPDGKLAVRKDGKRYRLTYDYISNTDRLLIVNNAYCHYDPKVLNWILHMVGTWREAQKAKARELLNR